MLVLVIKVWFMPFGKFQLIPSASKGIKLVNYMQFEHFESVNFRADILRQPWDILKGLFDPNEMWPN